MKHLFKRGIALLLALVMLCAVGCTPSNESVPPTTEDYSDIPEGHNQLVLYWDYTGDLETAAFWIWPEGGDGQGYPVEADAYGCKVVVNLPENVTRVGFIACYGCTSTSGSTWIGGTKDVDADRFIDMTARRVTAYLKSGDPNIYFSKDGGGSLDTVKEISIAGITSFNTIKYKINTVKKVTSLDQIKVMDGTRQVEVLSLSTLNNEVNNGVITLGEDLDLSKTYTLEIEGFGTKTVVPTTVFDSEEFLANYVYDGDDLGAVIQDDNSTTFKVWAPTASKVVLNLYTAGNGVDAYASLDMSKATKGVWELNVPDAGHGTYYTYSVTTCIGTQMAVDPYAKAAGVNGDRGMVVDFGRTDPAGWGSDKVISLDKYTDATIWEVHVRDFSNTISASKYPGKYLAFTERGLTNSAGVSVGVDYLLKLGVSHIHLLPVYDYASVNEMNPGFNWGYDPKNYNVPEGSYSTDPYNGEVRIHEFKQMVQSLHASGLGVIMDVVYNHTYESNSNLNKVVPYYYYRFNASGDNSNGSGCGNDTASERYMYRKYMVDSVSFWAEEYNLDGFRFDLMGLHDVETMQAIEKAVHAINPNAIIYGEAWTMSTATYGNTVLATQSNLNKITATAGSAGAVAAFNDAIRDGLKGSVFDAKGQGYINGAYAANALKIQFGIQGGATNNGVGWSIPGAAVINYMSAHDNNTLWDKLHLSNPDNTNEELLAMNRLGAAIVMISKGTPFWQAGEEMLRTKLNADGTFNENSYNASDAVNNMDWESLVPGTDAYNMMLYYTGLIEMRQTYEIFRSKGDDVSITFEALPGGGMAVKYVASNGEKAIVLINPTETADTFTLEGSWNLVANGTQAGASFLDNLSGQVTVDARSVLVFVN